MDRLNLIESQLAAIRSMTETINERLKNMESRLGLQRRY
jgi:chaperonin cofactor prefoldin